MSTSPESRSKLLPQPTPEHITPPEVARERAIEHAREGRGNLARTMLTSRAVSSGLDVVPFVGGGKIITEAVAGKRLSGEPLSGKERIVHGAVGTAALVLDVTGIGEIRFVGKAIPLVKKMAEKLGTRGLTRAAKLFERTVVFMEKHASLVAKAEGVAEQQLKKVLGEHAKKYGIKNSKTSI